MGKKQRGHSSLPGKMTFYRGMEKRFSGGKAGAFPTALRLFDLFEKKIPL